MINPNKLRSPVLPAKLSSGRNDQMMFKSVDAGNINKVNQTTSPGVVARLTGNDILRKSNEMRLSSNSATKTPLIK